MRRLALAPLMLLAALLVPRLALGQALSVPATVAPGASLTVSWSGLANPTPRDWVGLARPGVPGDPHLEWSYTTGAASGTTAFRISASRAPGTYEVRLFRNDSFTVAATSAPLTVGAVPVPPPVTAYGPRGPVGPDVPLTDAERVAFTRRVKVAGFTGAAITQALAQAKAAGIATVHLPAGTYLVSQVIRVPGGLTLLGEGSGTVLKAAGLATELLYVEGDNVRVTRLKLVGATSEWTDGSHDTGSFNKSRGVQNWGHQGLIVDHCRLSGWCYAVLIAADASGAVRHCQVVESRVNGYGYGVSGGYGADVTVTDNELGDCRAAVSINGQRPGVTGPAGWLTVAYNRFADQVPSPLQKACVDTHTGFTGPALIEHNDFRAHPVDAIGLTSGPGTIRGNRFSDYLRAVRLYTATEGGVSGSAHDVALSGNEFARVQVRYFVAPEARNITVDGVPYPVPGRGRPRRK